jgi:protein SHQ1
VGLVDLLFAYVYDHLTTDGDATVESAWTVSILSASLSWMEDWRYLSSAARGATPPTSSSNPSDDFETAVQEVLYSSLRRALIYPYLRSLTFALHCALQVADIVQQGPCCILRCLLQTRRVLNHSELYYLGDKLFIDPYLAWVQHQNSNLLSRRLAYMAQVVRQLVSAFGNVSTVEQCKHSLGLDLMRIEQEEEEEIEDHQQDDEHTSSSSDSDSDDADDDSSSNADTQSDNKDKKVMSTRLSPCHVAPLPESGRKEQPQSEKGAAVSSELLDCSLGFSSLHIVKPHENIEDGAFTVSPTMTTTDNPTEPSTTSKCAEQQEHFDASSLSSKPKQLIVALDD